jgi:tetratricopeptide (TPR) repeat protein
MTEERQQAYLELVQQLLNCESGQEPEILAAHAELVDEDLVATALAVAQMLEEREGQEAAGTVDWLRGFAKDLAQELGLSNGGSAPKAQLKFLMTLLQAVSDSEGDPQVLYPLLKQNLGLLDESLIGLLQTWAREAFAESEPELVRSIAMDIGNFGNLVQDFPLGNKAVNMDLAIACHELLAEIFTIEDEPEIWAQMQNNIADAYWHKPSGDRSDNLEFAIDTYHSALKVYNKGDYPLQWASVHNDLATAYIERIQGDREENLELAIKNCLLALQVRTREDFPIKWAMTQNNLANAYGNRIQGDRRKNLELSISYCLSTLEIYTKKDFPIEWARAQNNLGNAYWDIINGKEEENLELAINAYRSALEIRTKEDFPIQWSMTQNNLGNAYKIRIRGNREKNIEIAISAYQSALEIRTKEDLPIQWSMTQNNLGNTYMIRIRGNREKNLELATDCFCHALKIRTPDQLPIECLQSARSLGDLHFNEGQWQQAIRAYEQAMAAAETSRSWAIDDDRRQEILKEALSVYENAIQCAVNLQNYPQAIQYTERVRSRQLVELMASKDLYSNAQVPAEIQAYLQEYQQLNQDIENLQSFASAQIQQAEARKQWLYKQIRTHDPVLAGQIEIAPINRAEIQELITNAQTAILIFYSTNDDTHIFILKQNQEPELFIISNQGKQELQQWLIDNWLKPYKENTKVWQAQMPKLLTEIADRLQIHQIINNHLADIQELILVPHLLLHQIPFAALPIKQGFLGERFTLRSIPSCQILQYCQQRDPITTAIQGIVEDADGTLPGARYEGHKIAEIYQVQITCAAKPKPLLPTTANS